MDLMNWRLLSHRNESFRRNVPPIVNRSIFRSHSEMVILNFRIAGTVHVGKSTSVLGQDLCFLVHISDSLPVITVILCSLLPWLAWTGTVSRRAPDGLSGIFPFFLQWLQWSRYLVEQVKRKVDFSCCGSEGPKRFVMPTGAAVVSWTRQTKIS